MGSEDEDGAGTQTGREPDSSASAGGFAVLSLSPPARGARGMHCASVPPLECPHKATGRHCQVRARVRSHLCEATNLHMRACQRAAWDISCLGDSRTVPSRCCKQPRLSSGVPSAPGGCRWICCCPPDTCVPLQAPISSCIPGLKLLLPKPPSITRGC